MTRLFTQLGLLIALTLAMVVQPLVGTRAVAQSNACLIFFSTGKIAGKVTDSTGTPLNNVEVYAYTANGDYVAGLVINNTAGDYTFPSLSVGSYLLRFTPANGDLREWYNDRPDAASATPVTVNSGATTTVNVQLQAGTQVRVTVHNPDGYPVPNSLIKIFDQNGMLVATGITDSQGVALVSPGFPPGAYRLSAAGNVGSGLLEQYYNNKPTLSTADMITLTAGQSIAQIQMTLGRSASLSGTVTNAASGAPLQFATVAITGANINDQVQTNAQGQYTTRGLPSGTYRVTFRPDPGGAPGLASLERIVTLTAPNQLAQFDAALTLGGAISGFITNPNDAPLGGIRVYATSISDPTIYVSDPSDSRGLYTIVGLPNGQYTVQFVPSSGSGLAAEYYNDHPDTTHVDRVMVTAPNTTANINAVLDPLDAFVQFQMSNENGDRIADMQVNVLDPNTHKQVAHADKASNFAAVLNAGSYLVQFQPPDTGGACPYALEYYDNMLSSANATHLTIPVSSSLQLVTVKATLGIGSRISGTVVDATTDKPIENVKVSVYDSGGVLLPGNTTLIAFQTNVLGRYRTSPGLPSGNFRVKFEADGYVSMFSGGAWTLDAAQAVPSNATNVNVALQRGGTITGRITAADTGQVLEHALVTVYGDDNRVINTTLTLVDGSYSFSAMLPSGAYRIGVTPGQTEDGIPYFTGYQPVFSGSVSTLDAAQWINLVAPQSVTADLAMPREATATPTQPPAPSPTTAPNVTPSPSSAPTANPTVTPGVQRVFLPLVQR